MKKKIQIGQLKVGMYVARTDQSWFHVPFFRKRIQSQDIIEKLKASGVMEVVIDVDKGDDLVESSSATSPSPPSTPSRPDPFASPEQLAENLGRSSSVHANALAGTRDLMEKVRKGEVIDAKEADAQVTQLLDQIMNDPQSMLCISVLKNKDEYTFNHCVNASILALLVGKTLGLPSRELLVLGKGLLFHDIGKCMIPSEILSKPEALTAEEAQIVRTHVDKGLRYLQKVKGLDAEIFEIVGQHHERLDGSGYPGGLKGEAIGRFGSIAAVIDVYDALIHENYYKGSKDPTAVIRTLTESSGTIYDSRAVKALSDCIGIYPPGTVLMLDSGEVALSFEPNPLNPYRPKILLLSRVDGSFYDRPMPVHLNEPVLGLKKYKRSIITTMVLEDLPFDPFSILASYAPRAEEAR